MNVEDCQGQRDEASRGKGRGLYSVWLIPGRRQESHCLSSDLCEYVWF